MASSRSPNIVWITIDSVRADHTTMGGYDRDTTPHLDRIADANEGNWFDTCISQTRWSPASTASILTGTHLSTHGVGVKSPETRTLPKSLQTMPELLSKVGYESFGISGNQYFGPSTDMNRGFDQFILPEPKNFHKTVGISAMFNYLRNIRKFGALTTDKSRHNLALMLTHTAKKWAKSTAERGSPIFLYMHYNDTHYPYTPPRYFLEPYAEEINQSVDEVIDRSQEILSDVFECVADGLPIDSADMAALTAAYDASIAHHDHIIGELFDYIRDNVPGKTIFVITADHGETLGEHGWLGHHVVVSDELLHVPMVTHGLEVTNGATTTPVQHLDFTRTVLELVNAGHDQFEGVNLERDTREFAIAQRAPRWSDLEKLKEKNEKYEGDNHRWDAVNLIHDGKFKYATSDESAPDQLFLLPDESTNRIDDFPNVAETLAAELEVRLPEFANESTTGGEPGEFDEKARKRLEAMGYIQ